MPLSLDLLLLQERGIHIFWLPFLIITEMFVEPSDCLLYDTVPSVFKSILVF